MKSARAGGLAIAATLLAFSPALAAGEAKKMSCQKIYDICMKRAGSGHAAICQDMFDQAKRTGLWPAAQDERGVQHDATPCAD